MRKAAISTPIVDLSQINTLTEIIVRAGDPHDRNARRVMKDAYTRPDQGYSWNSGYLNAFPAWRDVR